MSLASPTLRRTLARGSLVACLIVTTVLATVLPQAIARAETVAADHLLVSEVVTGGTSASDELIELHNPTAAPLPLEGLELVYVSATGATLSRRAAWALDAPTVPPGGHVLIANELGIYAAIGDALYASGMAATGGSVALRIQGAETAIDAVGWGTAANSWMEGGAAPAPSAGSSIERLPGGALGSSQDTDDNALDFAVRSEPDPQNSESPPRPDPNATPPPTVGPTPSASPTAPPASPAPSATASPTPDAAVVPIAIARALPDGAVATVQGTALSGSTFTDGGGYVADGSGGIAVLVTGASFERGDHLRLSGELDDRFAQRTLRVDADDLVRLGTGSEPAPTMVATGAIGEGLEGRLAQVDATIVGAGSTLTTGVAFDLDDGSGVVRLVVPAASGIDVTGWGAGTTLELVGIVGQRDSSGTGLSGYRLQPRDAADVIRIGAPSEPTPAPSESQNPEASPTPSPGTGVVSIATARMLPKNSRTRVQGTVTLARGVVDGETAVIQDASGAIVLRLGDDVGPLASGEVVEVDGARSTKSGMETLRVTAPPRRLGSAALPAPRSVRTGQAGEALEAFRVAVRGALVAAARQASSGSVSFEIDDGSGPLRVFIGPSLAGDLGDLEGGAWVEVHGVLGQETTGAQPSRGYRVWLGRASDLRVLATPASGAEGGSEAGTGDGTVDGSAAGASLDALDDPASAADPNLRIGATLVSGPWPELELGGLLWDGTRLVGVDAGSAARVDAVLGARRVPVALEITGLRAVGTDPEMGVPTVAVPGESGSLVVGSAAPTPPSTTVPSGGDGPRWVSLVGRIVGSGSGLRLQFAGRSIRIDQRCDRPDPRPVGMVGVVGIAIADAGRLIVPCGGIDAAPVLGRSAPPPRARSSEGAAATLVGLPGTADTPAPMPVAATLLVLAAVLLGGGAVAARRFGAPTDHDPTSASDDGGEPAEAAPPVLTLVPLPRERAP